MGLERDVGSGGGPFAARAAGGASACDIPQRVQKRADGFSRLAHRWQVLVAVTASSQVPA
jgi:hypothetical protein